MGGRKLQNDVPINLGSDYKREALALRNKLLMFRFRNYAKCHVDPALVDRSVEPRLAQVFVPLLSIIDDAAARRSLHELMRQYDRELVADRGLEIEAEVLEVIRELREFDAEVSIREIANRLAERHGEDFGRKITPHWVGYQVRRKLGLKSERRKIGYAIASTEGPKLERLFAKYGIEDDPVNLVNSVNSTKGVEAAPPPQEPLST